MGGKAPGDPCDFQTRGEKGKGDLRYPVHGPASMPVTTFPMLSNLSPYGSSGTLPVTTMSWYTMFCITVVLAFACVAIRTSSNWGLKSTSPV